MKARSVVAHWGPWAPACSVHTSQKPATVTLILKHLWGTVENPFMLALHCPSDQPPEGVYLIGCNCDSNLDDAGFSSPLVARRAMTTGWQPGWQPAADWQSARLC